MEEAFLYRYFNGDTTQEENVELMQWAESSPENMERLNQERLVWLALMMHAGRQEKKAVRLSARRLLWPLTVVAAAALFVFGIFGLDESAVSQEHLQVVNVPAGQRVELILSDGTKVWLNSNTRLEYPAGFGSGQREVTLSGEGYFDVTRNEAQPFIVHTDRYDIEVLGTEFNVNSYERKDVPFMTSLISGSVRVTSTVDRTNTIVLEDSQCAVETADGMLQMNPLYDLDQFSWKDGLLSLKDVAFEDLLEEFGRYYDVNISLKNRTIAGVKCTGKFRKNDGVVHSLNALKILIGFEYEYDVDNKTITIR